MHPAAPCHVPPLKLILYRCGWACRFCHVHSRYSFRGARSFEETQAYDGEVAVQAFHDGQKMLSQIADDEPRALMQPPASNVEPGEHHGSLMRAAVLESALEATATQVDEPSAVDVENNMGNDGDVVVVAVKHASAEPAPADASWAQEKPDLTLPIPRRTPDGEPEALEEDPPKVPALDCDLENFPENDACIGVITL